MDMLPIRRAILSVTDKTGLVEFATFLSQNGVELVSTGGTMKALQAAGLPHAADIGVQRVPLAAGAHRRARAVRLQRLRLSFLLLLFFPVPRQLRPAWRYDHRALPAVHDDILPAPQHRRGPRGSQYGGKAQRTRQNGRIPPQKRQHFPGSRSRSWKA